MRIVLIGSVLFSVEMLRCLIEENASVVAVVTRRQTPSVSDWGDLSPLCAQNQIPIFHTESINDDVSVEWIASHDPDVIFCFGWSQILSTRILQIAPTGVVGYHPTLLPANRGRHPIIWALALGLEETGSTFFFMDEGVDSGPILSQKSVAILGDDTAGDLYARLIDVAKSQLRRFLPDLIRNSFALERQDHERANTWRKRSIDDGRIDFRMNADVIVRLVRSLGPPYVGAHVEFNGKYVRIWKATIGALTDGNIEPGKVIDVDLETGDITVKCADRTIVMVQHEFDPLPEVGVYL